MQSPPQWWRSRRHTWDTPRCPSEMPAGSCSSVAPTPRRNPKDRARDVHPGPGHPCLTSTDVAPVRPGPVRVRLGSPNFAMVPASACPVPTLGADGPPIQRREAARPPQHFAGPAAATESAGPADGAAAVTPRRGGGRPGARTRRRSRMYRPSSSHTSFIEISTKADFLCRVKAP